MKLMRFAILFMMVFVHFSYATNVKITHSYIELDKIQKVSRFRSGIGHNYSFDPAEPCRSMKHYFVPASNDPTQMPKIMSPVDGTIVEITAEWAGDKIDILAGNDADQIRISIFHVVRVPNINVGTAVTSGELLGTHIGPQTDSDIAIMDQSGALLSYFDLMTDDVFQEFSSYSEEPIIRSSMIISKAERDQYPLQCGPPPDEIILSPGVIENWINLKA